MLESGGDNQHKDLYLGIIVILAGIMTMLKSYDELNNGTMTRGQRIRKLIVGCFGSFVTVFLIFELLMYFGIPLRLSLAVSAVFGYLGGDLTIKIILGYIEKLVDKKIEKQ